MRPGVVLVRGLRARVRTMPTPPPPPPAICTRCASAIRPSLLIHHKRLIRSQLKVERRRVTMLRLHDWIWNHSDQLESLYRGADAEAQRASRVAVHLIPCHRCLPVVYSWLYFNTVTLWLVAPGRIGWALATSLPPVTSTRRSVLSGSLVPIEPDHLLPSCEMDPERR